MVLLKKMAYSKVGATEMLNRTGPGLRVDHTFEEALRLVLQQTGREMMNYEFTADS